MSDVKSSIVVFLAIACLVIGGLLGAFIFPTEIEIPGEGTNETDSPETNQTDCPECPECPTSEELEQAAIITGGYLLDELFLETAFNETLSDRELNLFDGEVEFDGDNYDAEEVFTLTNLELKANEEDFEGNVYLVIQEKGISYEFILSESLDTSSIGDDDETLVFDLLGEEVEVSKWENNETTFSMGSSYYLKEEESVVVNDKTVTLYVVFEDKVLVTVGDEDGTIGKRETAKIGGIEIFVKDIDYQSYQGGYKQATLIIGTDVESTISDGEEYEEDSIWEWVITPNSIGLTLIEEFTELDEDFNALAPEEKICLPNDYICVRYNGLIGEDTEEYNFEIDGKFVRVKGNFLKDIEDYDKVYIYTNGSIYEDDNLDLYIGKEVELGDTDSILTVNETHITINDFIVNLDLSWINVGIQDEDYLTDHGILIEGLDEGLAEGDSQEFTITVPEEKLEGIITVKQGGFEEIEEDTNQEDTETETEE